MLTKVRSDNELDIILSTNNTFIVSVFGGGERSIKLPRGHSLNVQSVEDYFHYLEDSSESNAWDYIKNWVSKYEQVYSINTQENYIDVDVLSNPLATYQGFSILYARMEDAIYHCDIFYNTALRDYSEAVSKIKDS